MIFESLLAENTVLKMLGLTFLTIIIMAAIEINYRSEELGDEEEQ